MDDPRPEKVAVVDEVRDRFAGADAVIITEYRGLTVRDLRELRSTLSAAGAEYRVYKNTLVRRATTQLDLDLGEQLLGPTALTFVNGRADGTPGDVVTVAKALKAFSKANPLLVLKGGLLGTALLDEQGVSRLAEVATRDELLARLAGGMAAPLRNFAGLLQAVPQKMAYALQALIEQAGGPVAPPDVPEGEAGPDHSEQPNEPEQPEQPGQNDPEQNDPDGTGHVVEDAAVDAADDAPQEEE